MALGDISAAVTHIRSRNPKSNLYLMGSADGAAIGVKYLSIYNDDKHIAGMVSVSNPFNVSAAVKDVSSWRKLYYGRFIASKMIAHAELNSSAINRVSEKHRMDFDFSKVKRSNTPLQFNENFTFKFHSFPEPADYYRRLSCVDDIKKINVPLLVLNAKNDPISS